TAKAFDAAGNTTTSSARVLTANIPQPPDSAILTWNANSESDLAGYNVYWGTSTGAYGVPDHVGLSTTHTLSGLSSGQTYYFAVTAVDNSGNESIYSSEVSKAIP